MSLTTTEPELLSLATVARRLGADARTMRGWGTLPTVQLGNKFFVFREHYEHFLERLRHQRADTGTTLTDFVYGDSTDPE